MTKRTPRIIGLLSANKVHIVPSAKQYYEINQLIVKEWTTEQKLALKILVCIEKHNDLDEPKIDWVDKYVRNLARATWRILSGCSRQIKAY